MDKDIERKFCQLFIAKGYRERFLFELYSTKKRRDAIGRLCHGVEKILKNSTIKEVSKVSTEEEILSNIKQLGNAEDGYLISLGDQDGKFDKIERLISIGVSTGMGFAIFMPEKEIAIVREEQCYGAPDVYYMKKEV